MNFTFLLEIFSRTGYGVRDVASMLLFMVQLETLYAAMLYHWNMIEPNDEQMHRESMLMPLLFASYENYVRLSESFQEGLRNMENLCFVRLLRLIWKIPRNRHSTTQ